MIWSMSKVPGRYYKTYDTLLQFLQSTVDKGFLGDWQMGLIRTDARVEPLLTELVQAAGLAPEAKLAGI